MNCGTPLRGLKIVTGSVIVAAILALGVRVLLVWVFIPPDRSGSPAFQAAATTLQTEEKRAVADLRADPQSYFKVRNDDCRVLHLSPDYLGQICIVRSIAEPPGRFDSVILLSQGPIHLDDGRFFGGVDTYFADPGPHGAHVIAEVSRDLAVQSYIP